MPEVKVKRRQDNSIKHIGEKNDFGPDFKGKQGLEVCTRLNFRGSWMAQMRQAEEARYAELRAKNRPVSQSYQEAIDRRAREAEAEELAKPKEREVVPAPFYTEPENYDSNLKLLSFEDIYNNTHNPNFVTPIKNLQKYFDYFDPSQIKPKSLLDSEITKYLDKIGQNILYPIDTPIIEPKEYNKYLDEIISNPDLK